MMATLSSYLRRGRHALHRLSLDPRFHTAARLAGSALAGFFLSAASLSNSPQPFALGLVLSASGWSAVMVGLGGTAGYLLFWGSYGLQGAVWMVLGLLGALGLGQRQLARQTPLLLSAVGTLIVAVTGLGFKLWGIDGIAVSLYLLRTVLAAGATWLFQTAAERREPFADWLVGAVAVLALAQIAPASWLCLGIMAAGAVSVTGAFPAVALAGLALDLAQVTRMPMTAVLCLVYLLRLIPWSKPWMLRLMPGAVHILMAALTGIWDPDPVPALVIGGLLGRFLPDQPKISHRRGETGVAQVRLEMAASVLAQTEELLLEAERIPIDEEALLLKAVERSCAGCPCRKNCRDRDAMAAMSPQLLHRPLLSPKDMTASCKKSGRVLVELHRSQEQLRAIRGSREQQAEYRSALVQQYQFLAYFLQDLSDGLARRGKEPKCSHSVRVTVYANRPAPDNGDRALWFAGTEGNYYVLLCDGMGTGLGAVDEGRTAGQMLKTMLSAGFPAEHALRSLNSLCALRGKAGAVTVDLAQIRLDTGRCTLYKWGAAPSYVLRDSGAEKIGTAGPPPGLSVQDARERVTRLSLRQGETLVLLSDGAAGEEIPRLWSGTSAPGELAARLLERGEGKDDATAVLICLEPCPAST